MRERRPISECALNAYVDAQLPVAERRRIERRLAVDAALCQRVAELRRLSRLVRYAYRSDSETFSFY